MSLKKAIIRVMTRDDLKRVVDALEIGTADHQNRGSMARSIGKRRDIQAEYLLQFLSEIQVKEVCELLGEDSTGRRSALVQMHLKLPGVHGPLSTSLQSPAMCPWIHPQDPKSLQGLSSLLL
jgi:hypothetical protein